MDKCSCGNACACGCGCAPGACSCAPGCGCKCSCAAPMTMASKIAARYLQENDPDPWITREDMSQICPSCSDRMAAEGLTRVRLSAIMKAAEPDMPKGWTAKSAKKFWTSLTGDAKHKMTACMKSMEGKVSNPGAFCNWAKKQSG